MYQVCFLLLETLNFFFVHGKIVVSPSRDSGWKKMKCEGSKSENGPSPWWVSGDLRLRRDSRNPSAFALCQPENLVEKCWQKLFNRSCSISLPFRAPLRQELNRAEHVPSAASSYCPDNLSSLWLIGSDSCISVIFTWTVLFFKMQHLFFHLEMEPFLAQSLLYLTGRNILIDFLVAFGHWSQFIW